MIKKIVVLFLLSSSITALFSVLLIQKVIAMNGAGVENLSLPNAIAFGAAIFGVVVGAITVTAYIVKLTNAINNLRAGLIDEVRKNHEEISDVKSVLALNSLNGDKKVELLQKDVIANYREISNFQIELGKRLTNLERFEAGRHGYQVRDTERME